MVEKILYKKDTTGKIRVLITSTEGGELIQKSGVLDGKLVEHRKPCKPKNVGKANSTTAEEQAISQLQSFVAKKLDKGYFESVDEAENNIVILPMLAKEYGKEKKKINWKIGAYVQPKLDGMRCLAHVSNGKIILISRDGKVIQNMMHIEKELSNIKDKVILDGELYKHGASFQENMSLIKKYREGLTEDVKFNVYDVVEDKPFGNRIFTARRYTTTPSVVEVFTTWVSNEDSFQELHESFVSEGYEGSILRHSNNKYKVGGRSSSLLKYKDLIDIAEPIVDVIQGDQRTEWGVPVFYLNGDKEKRFETGTKMTHEERIDLLINKEQYIGKTAEIRFPCYTDKGIPRHPIMVGFRLDK